MKKLLMLTIAAMALAIPASASADMFYDNGEPIGEEGVESEFSGETSIVFFFQPTDGIHCTTVDLRLLATTNEGHFTSATFDDCTTTPWNYPVKATPVNLSNWTAIPDAANSRIVIENVHINNKVTHPITKEVVSEGTLTGTVIARIAEGQMEAIESVDLEESSVILKFNSGFQPPVKMFGQLISDGTLGIGE